MACSAMHCVSGLVLLAMEPFGVAVATYLKEESSVVVECSSLQCTHRFVSPSCVGGDGNSDSTYTCSAMKLFG